MPMTAFCLHTAKCMQWKWMNVFAMPTLCVMLVYFCLSFFCVNFCIFVIFDEFLWPIRMSLFRPDAWRTKEAAIKAGWLLRWSWCVVAFAFMHIVCCFLSLFLLRIMFDTLNSRLQNVDCEMLRISVNERIETMVLVSKQKHEIKYVEWNKAETKSREPSQYHKQRNKEKEPVMWCSKLRSINKFCIFLVVIRPLANVVERD